METTGIEIDLADIRDARAARREAPPPAEGEARFVIERLALTANTVTYAAAGEALGYWRFFPCAEAGRGLVPAWGFARVEESRAAGLAPGARFYGVWPLASHAVLRPERVSTRGFSDGAPHRRELAPVYARYLARESLPAMDGEGEDRMALLQPLFVTSWLLHDFLADEGFFGAEQVVLSSASSKTAIGLATLLAEGGTPAVGLTSPGNLDFVEGLGVYARAIPYGRVAEDLPRRPSVFVDMAGAAEVRAAVHGALGEGLRHSAAVGTSHWDRFRPDAAPPGLKPVFFFAPSRIEKRRADWGGERLDARLQADVARLIAASARWLRVERRQGAAETLAAWAEAAAGRARPDAGTMVSVR